MRKRLSRPKLAPRHRRAVTQHVGGVGVLLEPQPQHQLDAQVRGVVGIHAGVDDCHDDRRRAGRQAPRQRSTDPPQVPLGGVGGVIGISRPYVHSNRALRTEGSGAAERLEHGGGGLLGTSMATAANPR